MKLEKAIKYMDADASKLNPALLQIEIDSFTIDSREAAAGAVFFALSQPDYKNNCFNGEFEDLHNYIPAAFENGASICVGRLDRFEVHRAALEKYQDRLIFVSDAIGALQKLAHGVYSEWNKPVVAITGSAGKTTARELTAQVLEAADLKILKSFKNYNNGLGLPLSVLKLTKDDSCDAAVLEMGMSTPMNEIRRLCRITPPDYAVELNVLPVHVEHLGSIENVAKAKAELVEGMKPDGTAILNADDTRVLAMRDLHKGKTITYGIENKADVTASELNMTRFGETRFTLNLPNGSAPVSLQLSGRHNVLNALAASAVGYAFEMSAGQIAAALNKIAPPPQRGEVLHFRSDFTIINDSYNSNPAALMGMVKTLIEGGQSAKRKIVVAGEMLELGIDEKEVHFEIGEKIAANGVDFLIGVRGLAGKLVEGARNAGIKEAKFFSSSEEAGDFLSQEIKAGDLVLVKGSRGVRTEKVIEKLLENFEISE